MQKHPSIAKITRPRLPGVLQRRRLFKLLDQGRSATVTWVSGPGGSGKTTLVASWLDARGHPYLWYQLDHGDNDIATFFLYLGLAVKKSVRSKGDLPLLTPEYTFGIPAFTRRYFESLYARMKPGSVIVLDNYHHIEPQSVFHDVLREALSTVPDGITVIIISRVPAPPVLAQLVIYNRVRSIGWDELKFDAREAGAILRSGRLHGIRGTEMDRLHRMTAGWAAGLVLLRERLRAGDPVAPAFVQVKSGGLFDYFASELFDKTDTETQLFLLKTAFLRDITPHAATGLTGREDAGLLLSSLYRNHYFTEQRSATDLVYRYHPLFREFLQARARETFSRGGVRDVMSRAARLLEGEGRFEEAADLYRDAEAWDGLVSLILANAKALAAQGRSRTLEGWLASIPETIAGREPWLLYWTGVCRMPFDLREGRRAFERSLVLFR